MLVDIAISGDVQVRRRLLRIGERAVDARPAFEAMGAALLEMERGQFESEGGRGGAPWAPLAESTVAQRGSAHPILEHSGALRSSLTERGVSNTFEATSSFLLFGSKVPYSGFHQTGTSRMPQRRPLELRESDRVGLVKVLQAYIVAGDEGLSASMAAALGAA